MYTVHHAQIYTFCHFYWASNTTNLDINFCTLVNPIIIYIYNFVFDFFETLNTVLKKIKKQAPYSSGTMSMLQLDIPI
jgi:hypothetical protein